MFEVFAALFGGGYLASRFSKDKRNKAAAQIETALRNAVIDNLTDYQLERNIEGKMFYLYKTGCSTPLKQLTESAKEIYEFRKYVVEQCIPENDLQYVFGDNWRDILQPPSTFITDGITSENAKDIVNDVIAVGTSNGFVNKWGIVFNILLSIDGVVCTRHQINGYQIGREIDGVPFDDRVEVVKRACAVIERNIQAKFGSSDEELRLYITTGDLHNLRWGFIIPEEIRVRLW